MPEIKLKDALDPLVLALDIGSTASRGRVVDARGTPVRGLRARIAHAITTAADGTAVLDPLALLGEIEAILDALLSEPKLRGRIAAVAMDTFASSLVGVDAADTALTPCYTYADSRPASRVLWLRERGDEAAVQQRTGCRYHTGYLPARLLWLRDTQPGVFTATMRWLSLGEFIFARLVGRYAASYSAAAWTGLLDRSVGGWDPAMLAVSGVHLGQFSPLHDTGAPLDDPDRRAATRWPTLDGAKWFPSVADGFASSIGSGALDDATMALAAGTSGAVRVVVAGSPPTVPPGLWCYRVDRRRSLLGGALNDVGRVLSWMERTLLLPGIEERNATLLAPPDATLPTVLPFLTGERSPGWAANARAAITDVTDATTPLQLFRAAMEGVALRYALTVAELTAAAPSIERIVASGGVTEVVPGWLQLVADALGRPVVRVARPQATLRGTALIALDVLAPGVPRAELEVAETYLPSEAHRAYYRDALARQADRYGRLLGGVGG